EGHAGCHVHACSVRHERRVERCEGALLPARVTSEVLPHEVTDRARTDDAGETPRTDASEDVGRCGELRHVPAVHKDHARAGAESHALDLRGRREWRAWTVGERESGYRGRGDAREPPL